MHTECAQQCAEESTGLLLSTQGGSYQDTSTGCIYEVRGPTPGQVCRYGPDKDPDICPGCFSTFSVLDLNHRDHHPGFQDLIDAISTAVELIGNANARISCLRREKVTLSLNKTLSSSISSQDHAVCCAIGTLKTVLLMCPPSNWGYHQKHGRGEASSYF